MTTSCLTDEVLLTLGCPHDRGQALYWDTEVKGLGVRVTPRGKHAFVFQSRSLGKSVRKTIGRVGELSIADARARAREIRLQLESKEKLNLLQGSEIGVRSGSSGPGAQSTMMVGQLWPRYLEHGQPRRSFGYSSNRSFSPGYIEDLRRMAAPGGTPKKLGSGVTLPGPLSSLMSLTIEQLDEFELRGWYRNQHVRSPAQATRSLMMLRGFLQWCLVRPETHGAAIAALKSAKLVLLSGQSPTHTRRTSVIQPSELPAWWATVLKLPNTRASVFLRALVMTGLHSQAMLNLRWNDFRLGRYHVAFSCHLYNRKKVPLTHEFMRLIESLPRVSEFVFSGDGRSGQITNPHHVFKRSLQVAGLDPMPLSTLRRTFVLLSEMAGVPSGVVARYTHVCPVGSREQYPHYKDAALLAHIRNVESTLKKILGTHSLV